MKKKKAAMPAALTACPKAAPMPMTASRKTTNDLGGRRNRSMASVSARRRRETVALALSEPGVDVDARGEDGEVATLEHRLSGRDQRAGGDPRERTTDADPLRAGFCDLLHRQPASREDVDRFRHGRADGPDLLHRLES